MERAENMARILEAGYRLAAMGTVVGGGHTEWHSTIIAAGCETGFYEKHAEATAEAAIDYLARDPTTRPRSCPASRPLGATAGRCARRSRPTCGMR